MGHGCHDCGCPNGSTCGVSDSPPRRIRKQTADRIIELVERDLADANFHSIGKLPTSLYLAIKRTKLLDESGLLTIARVIRQNIPQ